VLDDGRI